MAKRTRTHEQHEHGTGGAGVATSDDDHTAIHKPAPQKMAKGRPTIVELWLISALVGCVTKLLTWCMIYRRLRLSLPKSGG